MDCEQCMAQVALYLDTHAPRCADFDGLEILNAPNHATCALDPAAAIQLRPGTQSRARETTAPVRRDCRRGARLHRHHLHQHASHETCLRDQTIRPPPTRAGADESRDIRRMCGSPSRWLERRLARTCQRRLHRQTHPAESHSRTDARCGTAARIDSASMAPNTCTFF